MEDFHLIEKLQQVTFAALGPGLKACIHIFSQIP